MSKAPCGASGHSGQDRAGPQGAQPPTDRRGPGPGLLCVGKLMGGPAPRIPSCPHHPDTPSLSPQGPRSQDHKSPVRDRGLRPFGANAEPGLPPAHSAPRSLGQIPGRLRRLPHTPRSGLATAQSQRLPGGCRSPSRERGGADVLTAAAGTDSARRGLSHFKTTINFLCSLANLFN